jgi:hypothetical protein
MKIVHLFLAWFVVDIEPNLSQFISVSYLKINEPIEALHNFSLLSVTPLVNVLAKFLLSHIFSSIKYVEFRIINVTHKCC